MSVPTIKPPQTPDHISVSLGPQATSEVSDPAPVVEVIEVPTPQVLLSSKIPAPPGAPLGIPPGSVRLTVRCVAVVVLVTKLIDSTFSGTANAGSQGDPIYNAQETKYQKGMTLLTGSVVLLSAAFFMVEALGASLRLWRCLRHR